MKNSILIITSDTNSANYEIIKKSISYFKKKRKNNYIFIGNKKKIEKKIGVLRELNFININYTSEKKYLEKSFEKAFELILQKKAKGLINLPLNKKTFLGKKYPGVTEYISEKFNLKNKETMLLYSDKFSVSPVTTHIKLKKVYNKINQTKIINNIINIDNFYKKIIGIKKPKIAILGLNPHCGVDFFGSLEEKKIIIPAIKKVKNVNVAGPFSADTVFLEINKKKINSIIGQYHDQVLPTFKYANKFQGINVTLGLPFLRISPDHGTAKNLINKKHVDNTSFIYALNFFEKYYKKI